jgi:hypothetical protein
MLRESRRHSVWLRLRILAFLLALAGCGANRSFGPEAQARSAAQDLYLKAKAVFDERCKTAGVVVKRTVKDVDGIELTKIRQPIPWGGREYFDPMYLEAAMAGEHRGDDYIKQFLMSEFVYSLVAERRGELGPPTSDSLPANTTLKSGYRFVEFVDSKNQGRYRCVPDWSRNHPNWVNGQHRCAPVSDSRARFALDYDDVVDPSDRALWIAGTKLRIIDKHDGEVIAELTRYVWDAGFGSAATGRWPWEHANARGRSQTCPHQAGVRDDISRKFADTVLIPKQ